MRKNDNGLLLYESDDTIVICTGLKRKSDNPKTGPMAQTFILKRGTPPTYDSKGAGCEGCPVFDGCYVVWHQSPLSVYKAYGRRSYEKYTGSWLDLAKLDTHLRVGSAGEPTKMPAHKWREILGRVKSWTGYTHRWKQASNLSFRTFCMASVHSVKDMKKANDMGWRTYRVGGEPMTSSEIMCPHYTTGVQCIDCGLCSGTHSKGKNIYAPAHGARKGKIK